MNKLKHICLLIFFIFLAGSHLYSAPKNPNIERARSLIREGKYNEAREILISELAISPEYETLIMKLIDDIDKRVNETTTKTNEAISRIREGDSFEAEKLLNEIDYEADYDSKTNFVLKNIEDLKTRTAMNNDFLNLIGQAEQEMIKYKTDNAVPFYIRALDIYRTKEVSGHPLEDLIVRYNAYEQQFRDALFTIEFESTPKSTDYYDRQYSDISLKIKNWLATEKELLAFAAEFEKKQASVDNSLEFQAYLITINNYIHVLRRSIQNSHRLLSDYLFEYAQELTEEKDIFKRYANNALAGKLYSYLSNKQLEYYRFYEVAEIYNKSRFYTRSRKNIYEYTRFISRRYQLLLAIRTTDLEYRYTLNNTIYNTYQKNVEERDLFSAEKNLSQALEDNKALKIESNSTTKIYNVYEYANQTEVFKETYDDYYALQNKIKTLENDLVDERIRFANKMKDINNRQRKADRTFYAAEQLYKQRKYEEALEQYNQAATEYREIRSESDTAYVARQIKVISERQTAIDKIILELDVKKADEAFANAKSFLRKDDPEKAKDNIVVAELIYRKYPDLLNIDPILYWKERIEITLKIKAESELVWGDPLYEHIIELMKNANTAYGKKDYPEAERLVNQILKEKPFYQNARRLEAKILKITNPEDFELEYQKYFETAMDYYKGGEFSRALQEFQGLREFDHKLSELDKYIAICKRNMYKEPEKPKVDKDRALVLRNEAQALYQKGVYPQALKRIQEALRIWPEVNGGKTLFFDIIKRLPKGDTIIVDRLPEADEQKFIEATREYSAGNYQRSKELCDQILAKSGSAGLAYEKVRSLRKRAVIKISQS